MERRKVLVLATLFVGAAILVSLAWHRVTRLPQAISIDVQGLPAFGDARAKLKIVSFEDFRCCNCKRFHEKVFPQIWEDYIAKDKAVYVFVPVAFLGGAKPLANAALAVYHSSPGRFFAFVEALFERFHEEDPDREGLLEVAGKVGDIDLTYLEYAIREKAFYPQLERVLQWAKEIMGADFGVPALYINGVPSPTGSFQAVERRMKRIQQ